MAFEPRQTSVEGVGQGRLSGGAGTIEAWLEAEREHVPLWVPVGLGAGIGAWFALPDPDAWIAWCLLCGALVAAAQMLGPGSRLGAVLAGAGLLGCAGCLVVWGKAQWAGEPPIARAAFVELRGRVVSVEPLPAQSMVRVVVAPLDREDLPTRIRVNIVDKDVPAGLAPAALAQFRARLMPPAPPAVPGAYDFARRAYFLGIGATGRAVPPVRIIEPSVSPGPSVRQRLSAHIRSRVEGGAGAIAATLATGDRGAIGEEDAEAMRRSGLAHLLSISGLHVTALVGATIFLVFRLLALSTRLALRWPLMLIAAGAGAAAGIGYTWLTGAEVPTVRSCVAALLVLGGLALGREAITLRLVAAGAILVLCLWPEALTGPSFQMSFAAITAIVALGEHPRFRALTAGRDEAMPLRLARNLLGLFLTGVLVEVVLAPIALFHFHQAGMLGSLANLVAIPLTTFVIMPFEALALLLDIGGLGLPAWWVVGQALSLLLRLAHSMAAMPGAVALAPAFPGWAFVLIVLGGLWCLLWRTGQRWLGLGPIAIGVVAMVTAGQPDMLVTGDGRHVMIRAADGRMALLRDRAGDYVRETLSENAGYEGAISAIQDLPEARCSRDLCAVSIAGPAGGWRLLATRSAMLVPAARLARDCRDADIVVSDRRLPRSCRPRWLRIDRAMLRRTGGVALYPGARRMTTVRNAADRHPWIAPSEGGRRAPQL